MLNKITKRALTATAAVPLLSFDQPFRPFGGSLPGSQVAPVRSFEDVLDKLYLAVNWFQVIIFVVAVIMILYAAFLFVTAAGDEGQVKKARTILIWAVIGIAVAILAFGFQPLVEQFLGL